MAAGCNARGRESNHSLNIGIRKDAVELVRTKYANFGPTLPLSLPRSTRESLFDQKSIERRLQQRNR